MNSRRYRGSGFVVVVGGGVNLTPSIFFGFKFLFLYRLPKALVQLSFFVNTSFDPKYVT